MVYHCKNTLVIQVVCATHHEVHVIFSKYVFSTLLEEVPPHMGWRMAKMPENITQEVIKEEVL